MRLLKQFGACDCRSHVFGPFDALPPSPQRAYDSPEAPLEALESVWRGIGIDRAVLVQASIYGPHHRALLAALQRDPKTRRGVALLRHTGGAAELNEFHSNGIRAVRMHWLKHLADDNRSEEQRMVEASAFCERLAPPGWHITLWPNGGSEK
jgi:2-pyrone-4,6-dicarboxylate lactonase